MRYDNHVPASRYNKAPGFVDTDAVPASSGVMSQTWLGEASTPGHVGEVVTCDLRLKQVVGMRGLTKNTYELLMVGT